MERNIIANQLTDDNLDTVTGGVVFVVPAAWAVYAFAAGVGVGAGISIGTLIALKK